MLFLGARSFYRACFLKQREPLMYYGDGTLTMKRFTYLVLLPIHVLAATSVIVFSYEAIIMKDVANFFDCLGFLLFFYLFGFGILFFIRGVLVDSENQILKKTNGRVF